MRTLALVLACCTALSAAMPATAAQEPSAHVEVSQSAASLPGPTYAWVPMPARLSAESDPRVQDPQLRARLQASLDKALQAKGYRRIDDLRQADIAVAYRVGVRDVQQATVRESTTLASAPETAVECSLGAGCSQIVTQGENGVPTIKVHTVDEVEGGLMVEVIQPSDIRVLWRALYRGSVRAKDAKKVNLDAIATRTLEQLPRAPAK
ncbi:DUF4136 domain-containing protein [Lysobacter niastensis]|uniref:DUF4136 domain-containing protein n=1 Tax=Lysobacter niastensis TaxID=380629 RepID=A0ABS0B6Q5_9GAMM|nr:DUF4136 domain-containing protein [Lysobacter niastensis]MBF6024563.1 DUF4136 domain-containing protein [Lysobacter niastensis]